jgi:hypothetical protein
VSTLETLRNTRDSMHKSALQNSDGHRPFAARGNERVDHEGARGNAPGFLQRDYVAVPPLDFPARMRDFLVRGFEQQVPRGFNQAHAATVPAHDPPQGAGEEADRDGAEDAD